MSKNITKEETKNIAHLCNLSLSEKELEKLSVLLSDTLDYINVLNELAVENVQETYQVTGLENVFMTRKVGEHTLTQKEALQNASEVVDDKFATEAVFDR